MKAFETTTVRYRSVDGSEHDDAEKAIRADLRFILEPHCYRGMGTGDVADILWNNRDLIVQTLSQLQKDFQKVEGPDVGGN